MKDVHTWTNNNTESIVVCTENLGMNFMVEINMEQQRREKAESRAE